MIGECAVEGGGIVTRFSRMIEAEDWRGRSSVRLTALEVEKVETMILRGCLKMAAMLLPVRCFMLGSRGLLDGGCECFAF